MLKKISLESNTINEMAFLNGYGKLEQVNLSDNKVVRIPELYGLVSLVSLSLR